MKAKLFMIPKAQVFTMRDNQPLKEGAILLTEKHIGSIVIVNQNKEAIGIVTKTDLINALYIKHMNPLSTTVKEIMSSNLIYVNENDERDRVASDMNDKKVHHVLVKRSEENKKEEGEEHSNWVGLITSFDITKEAALDAKAYPYEGLRSKQAALKYKAMNSKGFSSVY
ncbi:hypothetical protein ABK040_014885 [Willaertia magna]